MSALRYRTTPEETTDLPGGVPYIVGNEGAERFSYYGMRAILVIFMTQYLRDASGAVAPMSETEARAVYHLFSGSVYFFPLVGALISDAILGKYRTIMCLSSVYCLGHLALAIDETRLGLRIGLALIALGSGGIKPCVSAHVGDQFGNANRNLLGRVFGWFYVAINVGAFVSSLLTPWLLARHGSHVAFAVPGILMLIATIVFWLGRHRFVHVPPRPSALLSELRDRETLRGLARLVPIYLFVAVFWSLYDQTGSSWVLQAERMDLRFAGIEWYPAQIQAINPALILVLVPLFSNVIYPFACRYMELTAVRKIFAGMMLAGLSFLIPAYIELRIAAGGLPSVGWQLGAYVVITAAEVLVSVTALEFSYTHAPKTLKSLVMAFYLLSVSLGNLFTAAINYAISIEQGGSSSLAGADYYIFFAGLMVTSALAFGALTRRFQERTILQTEEPAA